ncbi:M23 family metallopeptidase [Shimia sp. R11_0]|uniref:M23 family metallopeptidase n=1 Tax=Shimia sp. R11_0 TaxID=2821096 RepID=UPI001ADAD55D|nr:M23 family metallopeptidase [Shimia sp. R11_0]MBO9478822.1 M23 family metallopeptidase [Shimia sp. R11_0]
MLTRSIALIGALAAYPAAGAPTFSTPVDCELGTSCFVQNYVDHDPGPGHQDHSCGPLSYDGHKGTDFALPSLLAMQEGVDVLAAADGIVTGTRDGMADRLFRVENSPALNGRDCGNGVVVDHGDGWVTQYCHMKQDSVAVAQGDRVRRGQPLGEIGLSGRTQFPHLHISVRHNDQVVDPYSADTSGPSPDQCKGPHRSLWEAPLAYVPGGLIRAGFDVTIPTYEDVKSGIAGRAEIPSQAKALVLFAYAYGSRANDILELRISGPEGEIFSHAVTLEKAQAQYFRAGGKRTPMGGWPKGAYLGHVRILRDGKVLDHSEVPLTIQ